MIDTAPESIKREIDASESKLEKMFACTKQAIDRYTTTYFRGEATQASQGENRIYEWIQLLSMTCVGGIPSWIATPRTSDRGRQMAIAIQYGLTRNAIDTRIKSTLQKLFVDYSFRRAVGLIRRRPLKYSDVGPRSGPRYRPQLSRLSLQQFGYDAVSTDHDEDRLQWHKGIWDLDHLLDAADENKKAGWRRDVLNDLRPGDGQDKINDLRGIGSGNGSRTPSPDVSDRPDILVYQVWIPEESADDRFTPEDGFNGTVHTYALTDSGRQARSRRGDRDTGRDVGLLEIRDPQPYFGPPQGPYVIIGQDYVPDEAEHLSQFVAFEGLMRSLQVRGAVIDKAMQDYMEVLIVDNTDSSLPHKLKNARHRHVLAVKGFEAKNAQTYRFGGISAEMSTEYGFELARADRAFGVFEALAGNTNPNVSATADAIAQGGMNRRTAKLRDPWLDGQSEIGRRWAWYLYHDDQMVFPLGPDAARELGVEEPWFLGGANAGESFEDLEINIEPTSTSYASEEGNQAQTLQLVQILAEIAQMTVAYPFMDTRGILEAVGEAYHRPQLAELINTKVGQAMGAAQFGLQMQAGQDVGKGQPTQSPRLAKDQPATRPMAQSGGTQAGGRQPFPGQSSGSKAGGAAKPKSKQMVGAK